MLLVNAKEEKLKTIRKFKLKTQFTFDEKLMELFEIPKMEIEGHEDKKEAWTFCKFDKKYKKYTKNRKYLVSTFGRLYNLEKGKIHPQHESTNKNSNDEHYMYTSMNLEKDVDISIAVHRLVALAFVKQPKGKDVVDHKDERPKHNYAWNLQWVDKSTNSNKHNMYVARERTGRAVDTTWKYEELVAICKMMAEGHKATYIYNEMLKLTNNNPKIQYERIRTLYKHIMRRGDFHDIAVKCGVKFESNTLKEKSSVAKVQAEKAAEKEAKKEEKKVEDSNQNENKQ